MLLKFIDGVKEWRLKTDQDRVYAFDKSRDTSSSSTTGLGAREAMEGTEGARRGAIVRVVVGQGKIKRGVETGA